jgi:hypothetical protein
VVSYVAAGYRPLTDEERAQRMIEAMLSNIEAWREQVEEIAANSIPITGNLGRALHLLKNMEQSRIALRKLAGLPEDTPKG